MESETTLMPHLSPRTKLSGILLSGQDPLFTKDQDLNKIPLPVQSHLCHLRKDLVNKVIIF